MKTPTWEISTGALAAFLNGTTVAYRCELYTLVLADGVTAYRWTSGDIAVTVNALAFVLGPVIKRSTIKRSVGISVDTMTLQISADATVQVAGSSINGAIALGKLFGARMTCERLYGDLSSGVMTPVGTLGLFQGAIGRTRTGLGLAEIEVRTDASRLDIMVPGAVYQGPCRRTLFDSGCTLSPATYTITGTVTGQAGDRRGFVASALAQAGGWFDQGVVTFTSGANAGVSRQVRTHAAGGSIDAVAPWLADIGVGDTFSVRPGCNKTAAMCGPAKFNNLVNYGGEPLLPAPETVL